MACNAGTELSCINNIEEHVNVQNMPVLPHILHRLVNFLDPNLNLFDKQTECNMIINLPKIVLFFNCAGWC